MTALAATDQALVNWTTPANDGSPITSYTITPFIGTTAQTPVQVNNGSATSATVTGLTNGTAYTFKVTATNAIGTSAASAASSGDHARTTRSSTSRRRPCVDSNDGGSGNLGVKFTADTSGQILGIRFYKAVDQHRYAHRKPVDAQAASCSPPRTSANESPSGWQTVLFSSPVSITAGTHLRGQLLRSQRPLLVHAGGVRLGGRQPAAARPIAATSAPTACTTTARPAASRRTATTPATTGSTSLFQPTAPGQVTNVTATAGQQSANVSWTAPSSGGVTSYTVTPYIGATAQTPTTVNGNPPATSTTVTGLQAGTAYTFKVTGVQRAGLRPGLGGVEFRHSDGADRARRARPA